MVPPGVFRPHSDTWLLAERVRRLTLPEHEVLDLCTGSGAVAVTAARAGAREVTAVDISRRAVGAAWINARLNGARLRAVRGDLFGAVGGRRFDLVSSNPPYVPAASDDLPDRGPERAWDAGRDGRTLLDRIIAAAPAHLRPGGRLVLVHSSVCGTDTTLNAMEEAGLGPSILERRRGPLGGILTGRARELEDRGLLRRGQRHEEIIVLAGEKRE